MRSQDIFDARFPVPRLLAGCLMLLSLVAAPASGQGGACGNPFENHYGPFDYRTAQPETRSVVERHHFTPRVETLRGGQSSMHIGADISYTLKVFPNHPRALLAMAELARREKHAQPKGSEYDLECWFDRALRFRPDDAEIRLVIGIALMKDRKYGRAIEQLELAEKAFPQRPDVPYNLGLAYYYMKDYDKAVMYARRAYELGFPLPGLRDMLQKAGKWH